MLLSIDLTQKTRSHKKIFVDIMRQKLKLMGENLKLFTIIYWWKSLKVDNTEDQNHLALKKAQAIS